MRIYYKNSNNDSLFYEFLVFQYIFSNSFSRQVFDSNFELGNFSHYQLYTIILSLYLFYIASFNYSLLQ